SARRAFMDRGQLRGAAGLLLSDATAAAQSGTHPRQHQLCLGHERPCGADTRASLCLVFGLADRPAASCLCSDPLGFGARGAERTRGKTRGGRVMLAPSAKPVRYVRLRNALRFAWRELRGGLRGFGVFIACIALGVMAIAGVGSVAASLNDGIAGAGR